MNDDCVFCKIVSGEFSSYKIYEDEDILSFLSIEPDSFGHSLVIPKKHYITYEDIPLELLDKLNNVGKIVYEKLQKNLKCDGIKLIQNNGIIQEVKHFHLHLIPVYTTEKEDKTNLKEVLNAINTE